jgi:hypothetical protein
LPVLLGKPGTCPPKRRKPTTMRRKPRLIAVLATTVLLLVLAGCVEDGSADTTEPATETTEPAPDTTAASPGTTEPVDIPEEIVIGNPIALSGPNNAGASLTQIPSYDLWVEDVNAAGGIFVEEYDTSLPVRIDRVDDTVTGWRQLISR